MKKLFASIITAAAFSSALFAAPSMKVVMDKQLVKPGEPIKITVHYQMEKNEKVSCYYFEQKPRIQSRILFLFFFLGLNMLKDTQ